MHYLDANYTAGEEARRQLLKNAASNIEQVLTATPHKAPNIRPPASHRENYPRLLRAILSKSWRQHLTRHQLYGHLPPIAKTIQVRSTRHTGHCWRSRDELISDLLVWTPTYDRAKAGWSARTYILQLCEDMGCGPEDLPEAMNDREKWRKSVKDIRACGTTWWYCVSPFKQLSY